MVVIRFPDDAAKRRAMGWLAGRFSFTSRAGGPMLVPVAALVQLALEGIPFFSEGPATYEQIIAPMGPSAAPAR